MKKLLLLISFACAIVGCAKIEEAIDDLNNRVSELEGARIPTVEQQVNSIKTTVADLESVSDALKARIAELEANKDSSAEEIAALKARIAELEADKNSSAEEIASLKARIAELEANGGSSDEEIAALKAKDGELEQSISSLREYIDSLNNSTKDWVAATYSTLEQYNALSARLANLQTLLDNHKNESGAALSDAISALESSMKSWINEQLSNYYTIAQVDAQIAELQELINKNDDEALINDINALKSSLQTLESELVEAYKKAISDAITENNGVIDAKIASGIESVNSRIDSEIATINAKISTIESRLDELEGKVDEIMNRKLDITFEAENDGVVAEGGYCKVHYNITSSESEVYIATIVQNGWKATITEESEKSGYITVYAPQPWNDEPIIVLVSDSNTTIMRTLNFTRAIAEVEVEEIYVDRIQVNVKAIVKINKPYLVRILDGWLKLQEIKRLENGYDEVSLDLEANTSPESRRTIVEFLCDEVVIATITVYQDGASNVIRYTSSDNDVIRPMGNSDIEAFGAKIVSNTYENGVGIITFDSDVTKIGLNAFRGRTSLTSITLPSKVTSVGPYAFYGCAGLTSIGLPHEVTIIKEHTFHSCTQLTSVTMGDKVETIESYAFCSCENLTGITFSKNLTTVGNNAFFECDSLTEITTDNIQTLGDFGFSSCERLAKVTLSHGLKELGRNVFSDCVGLKYVYCMPATPPAGGYNAFFNIDPDAQIIVPEASWGAYVSAENWKDYSSIIKY